MSTLTSAQLCVKRSSTRLHAPPGGHSSLSFGPGGFGTVDGGEKGDANPAEQLPPSRGGYGCSGTPGSSGSSNYYAVGSRPPPTSSGYPVSSSSSSSNYYAVGSQPPPTSGGYGGSYGGSTNYSYSSPAPPPATSGDYRASSSSSSSSYYGGHAQPPPVTNNGYTGSSGFTPRGSVQPPVASASARWGAQPPLTSSKRDQNWEKKRRLWLARAAADAPPPPPSAASCGWGEAPPASPLSKFMQQHASRLPTAPPSASSERSAAAPEGRAGTRAGSRQPPGGRSQWSPFG